jgi:hypothetical protein
MTEFPPDLRPKTYAALELFLDVLHSVRTVVQIDLESIAIYLCVAEATVRPVVADPETVHRLSTVPVAPEELRGSISMLLVADRLGLPRETVRRKVKKLVEMNLLYQDTEGRFRSTPNFDNPQMRAAVAATHDAVQRYRDRLARYGIHS